MVPELIDSEEWQGNGRSSSNLRERNKTAVGFVNGVCACQLAAFPKNLMLPGWIFAYLIKIHKTSLSSKNNRK